MKVKKSHPVVGHIKVKMPNKHENLELFYFSVVILADGHIVATQQPGESPSKSDANTSTLALADMGVALEITWFPEKPAPESDARREGLLAVMDDIVNRLPKEMRERMLSGFFGVGHAYGARLEQNED